MGTFKNDDSDEKKEYHRVDIRFNFVENTCDQRIEYKEDHIALVPVENSGSISLVGSENGSSENLANQSINQLRKKVIF